MAGDPRAGAVPDRQESGVYAPFPDSADSVQFHRVRRSGQDGRHLGGNRRQGNRDARSRDFAGRFAARICFGGNPGQSDFEPLLRRQQQCLGRHVERGAALYQQPCAAGAALPRQIDSEHPVDYAVSR